MIKKNLYKLCVYDRRNLHNKQNRIVTDDLIWSENDSESEQFSHSLLQTLRMAAGKNPKSSAQVKYNTNTKKC